MASKYPQLSYLNKWVKDKKFINGKHYGNVDCLQYREGWHVQPHADAPQLIENESLAYTNYAVIKTDIGMEHMHTASDDNIGFYKAAQPHILCNAARTSTGCNHHSTTNTNHREIIELDNIDMFYSWGHHKLKTKQISNIKSFTFIFLSLIHI